jgi:hypothetical protein
VVRVCIPPLSSHLSGTAAVTPPPVPTSRPITPVPPYLPDPSPIRSPETLPTTSSISDVRLPHIPTSPSAYTSQEPSRLSTIDESPSSESPSIRYSSSSPSVTVCRYQSPHQSPRHRLPCLPPHFEHLLPQPVLTPLPTPERAPIALTRMPSSVSTVSSISLGSDILDGTTR